MKSGFYLVLFLLTGFGCSSDDDEGQAETTTYSVFGDSTISIPSDADFFVVTVVDGPNLVFEYEFVQESDPNLSDSGFTESILFELPADTQDFSFQDEELATISTFYRQICFCANTQSIAVFNGQISGAKIDANSWQITIAIDVIFEAGQLPLTKNISARFTLQ